MGARVEDPERPCRPIAPRKPLEISTSNDAISSERQHRRILRRRAELVLSIARDHSVDRLILGAWGAGVFGNDPAMVARVFKQLLAEKFSSTFGEVVFAIAGGGGGANYDAFAAAFT